MGLKREIGERRSDGAEVGLLDRAPNLQNELEAGVIARRQPDGQPTGHHDGVGFFLLGPWQVDEDVGVTRVEERRAGLHE